MAEEARMQDHNIVVEQEVEQAESYWKNIRALGKEGNWALVRIKIWCADENRGSTNSISQLLRPMNIDKDTIVHRAAFDGQTVVVRKLLQLINKEDNQELWRERQANIDGNNPLHLAAVKAHEDTCKCLADMDPELVKATNADGNTPLHLLAARWCYKDTCKYLAERAPEAVKATNKDGNTPPHMAALNGYADTCESLAEMAPEIAKAPNEDGNTPLHLAAASWSRKGTWKFLFDLAREAAVATNKDKNTPLHLVILNGYADTCKWLAEMAPESANATNKDGNTPLHLVAAKLGNEDTCKFLAERAPETAKATNKDGNTPLHLAILNGYADTCRWLANSESAKATNKDGNTPLHLAAASWRLEDTWKFLVEMAPETAKATNKDKNTPLHLAILNGDADTCKWLAKIAPESAEATNKDGNTPLHLAILSGYADTCKWLAKMAPESAKATNKDGNTPLHLVANKLGNADTCKYLAEMAPETAKARNVDGDTPIFVAALSGCELVFKTLTSMFLDDPEIALARKKDGDTILHCAILGECFDLASTIIDKHKVLIHYRNKEGLTPLHLLANNPSAFRSGCQFGLLQQFIYKCKKVSIESKSEKCPCFKSICRSMFACLSRCLQKASDCGEWFFLDNATGGCLNKAFNCVKCLLMCLYIVVGCPVLLVGCLVFLFGCFGFAVLMVVSSGVLVLVFLGFFFMVLLLLPVGIFVAYISSIFGFPWWEWIQEIRKTREKKLKHKSVEKVMKQLVHGIDHWAEFGKNNKGGMIESPFFIAARKGVTEMVKEILRKFPMVIDDTDLEDKNIMQLAAEHRQPEIFALVLYGIDREREISLFGKMDAEGNSVLHLAAKYPQGQPILIPGAASQMNYEYKWFQFVKETMPPHFSNRLNHKGQTAMEVFIITHQDLAKERANWLRNAMQSFSIVAALITTVAFATMSAVPGGLLQDKGSPVFQGSDNFNTFSLSSFFAFFFSAMSLLIFICAVVLPKDLDFANKRSMRLTWGANFLFISIVAMFISFFYGDMLVLDKKFKYLAYPTFILTFCVAITNSPLSLRDVFPILSDEIVKRAYPNNISL